MEDEGSWPLVRGHPFVFYLEYLAVLLQPQLKERKEVSCIPHHHLPPNMLHIKQCTPGYTAKPHSQTAHDSLFHLTPSFSAKRISEKNQVEVQHRICRKQKCSTC
jgi:hypothetical protein